MLLQHFCRIKPTSSLICFANIIAVITRIGAEFPFILHKGCIELSWQMNFYTALKWCKNEKCLNYYDLDWIKSAGILPAPHSKRFFFFFAAMHFNFFPPHPGKDCWDRKNVSPSVLLAAFVPMRMSPREELQHLIRIGILKTERHVHIQGTRNRTEKWISKTLINKHSGASI